ncbi:MAG: poly-gamma-glutamate system protein [Longimicrobiales bacterium]|nr:poly-gamma-glutamate system protein [Longimicrobiales bacterium]
MIRVRFLWAGGVSLLFWVALRLFAPGAAVSWTANMVEAATAMNRALETVAVHCRELGIFIEVGLDPSGTCLIGPEHTELFTSLGQLEAKRTTTAPDMAGLLAHLLDEAGVEEGDRVAVGASGSFPALLVATLTAVEAIGAEPVTILSLGASSFGATRPAFHILDLYELMEAGGLVSVPPAAVSLGGSEDVGSEFDPVFRADLLAGLLGRDLPVLQNPELRANVERRMALFGSVDAFVNIGGAEVNLGISPRILNVPPGLVTGVGGLPPGDIPEGAIPPVNERGVLFEMASRGVPVIHLLHVRGLALRYGLPWDPLPLPPPGSTSFRDAHKGNGLLFWLLTIGYLGALAVVAFAGREERGPETVR